MEMRSRGGVSKLSVAILATMLGGCVINPYIKTAAVPKGSGQDSRIVGCTKSVGGDVVESDAIQYAECNRLAMERKAGKYAWMNNGGGALLLNMAGFAGYSGIRGGHNAQVAAFTTGGASIYGTQQYLYRKPREAIYWSGANAISCAIGVTRRRSGISAEIAALRDIREQVVTRTPGLLDSALQNERSERTKLGDTTGCAAAERSELGDLFKSVDAINAADAKAAIESRRTNLDLSMQRLSAMEVYAQQDLIAATDAIRETVNHQLALEQPEPAELAKLLSTLKLPALAGAGAGDETPKQAPLAARQPASIDENTATRAAASRAPPACPSTVAYRTAAVDLLNLQRRYERELSNLEAQVGDIRANALGSSGDGDQLKFCTLARTNVLLPFGLKLAGAGAQKVIAGETLSVPIVGGVPPYRITPIEAQAGIGAEPKLDADGGYLFLITVPADTAPGRATFFVRDSAGAGDAFVIEVTET